MKKNFDLTIIGGGIVGLTLAALLADAKLSIAIIQNVIPKEDSPYSLDQRVSAFNHFSISIFQQLGIWSKILSLNKQEQSHIKASPPVGPYSQMQVWDSTNQGEIFFDAKEIGRDTLGFIVPNHVLISSLWSLVQNQENVKFFVPDSPVSIEENKSNIQLKLSSGSELHSRFIIGADGGNSWVRSTLKFPLTRVPYQQLAMVATVRAETAAPKRAYQAFLPEGPLALLPLWEDNLFSIVWSGPIGFIQNIQALSPTALGEALQQAYDGRLGKITLVTQPKFFPLVKQHVAKYVHALNENTGAILIGDAAHTVHPLAGLGVNLGIADARVLADKMFDASVAGRDMLGLSCLRRFERERKSDNTIMMLGINSLQTIFKNPQGLVRLIAGQGLNWVNNQKLVKQAFMSKALGE